ncbi:MAG: GTP 3',8-cyclase MoaA [Anaerolineales bacterium]
MLTDPFGRNITYLRISLTDRCNLRCVYCLPERNIDWLKREDLLSADEIVRVVEAAADLGVQKIRLTGGEPLVRPDALEIVSRIASTPGIREVSITTNAMLLEKMAQPLAEAGLTRVNVSLDTLDPEKFHRITRFGGIDRVWRGLQAAQDAGLTPLKINTVVVRGVNDDELLSLARLSVENPWHIRFIELMPVGNQQSWGAGFPDVDRYFSIREMHECLAPLDMQPDSAPVGNGPARTFRIPHALGTVGFISPVGEHFCENCNRLRLTADGRLRACLLLDREIPVRETLRSGGDLKALLQAATDQKPRGHELELNHLPEARRMAQIGG